MNNDEMLKIKEGIARYKARGADKPEFEILNMVDDCSFQWPVAVWLLNKIINMPSHNDFVILGKTQKKAWDWCADDLIKALHELEVNFRIANANKQLILSENRRVIFCATNNIESLFGLQLASAAILTKRCGNNTEVRNKLQPFAACGKITSKLSDNNAD